MPHVHCALTGQFNVYINACVQLSSVLDFIGYDNTNFALSLGLLSTFE